jgi:NAD-dependent SIR2 family protein deacetylase
VDGQFQTAGFSEDQVLECHGSISHLQCTTPCCDEIWSAEGLHVEVDDKTFRTASDLPTCEHCVTSLARPNVLMFGDWHWVAHRTADQERRFQQWLQSAAGPSLVIVEMGAGSAVPTVRMTSERVARACSAKLIRINPREPHVPYGQIGIEGNALEALEAIDEAVKSWG